MITYKNISYSAKTFYGVRFEPGETKSVPGYVNCSGMVRVFVPKAKLKPSKIILEEPAVTRKRKKTNEPEKDSVAETQEIKITSEEETSNGNPS